MYMKMLDENLYDYVLDKNIGMYIKINNNFILRTWKYKNAHRK